VTVTENDNRSLLVGDLLVEPELNKISRNLKTINLRPQVMELLVFLASNEGQVVSVEELLDKLWSGKVVTDGTLYNCIGELRHAISSLDDTQSYIENIPKKGYRLSATVENLGKPPITPAAEETRPRRRSILAWALPPAMFLGIKRTEDSENKSSLTVSNKFNLALVGGLFVAVAVIFYLAWPRDDRSIAVLPFEDMSPGGDQAYFGHGIADELRLELQGLDGLRVAGRTSSIASAQEDSRTIGEILNVDSILEGSIRKEENSVRISVQLTHVADGFTIWSKSYNRELENIFEMQEEIATSVAGALGVRLGVGTINAFRGAGTRNVEAYEAYLQSQNHNLTRQEQIRLVERAIELDPNYAAAWSYLGHRTLGTLWGASSDPDQASEIKDRAYSLVLRGVQLNPESVGAQARLAMVRGARLDWIGAEQGLRRAIELLADRPIVTIYANTLIRNGRTTFAQKQYGIAKALEPLGGRAVGLSWQASVAQGRFAEAKERSNWQVPVERIENNLDIAFNERDPEKLKVAIQAMLKTNIAAISLYVPVLAEFESPERVLSILHDVYLDEDLQWPRKLHDIAMVAAYFGDPQFALKVKGQEVRTSTTRLAAVWYPVMSEVRQLPEFKKLVTELNLVAYWRAYGWADACRPLGDDDFECF
jgi:TolB-like protein/DNA-binding winged helix-turn-helix (wHTH) protein